MLNFSTAQINLHNLLNLSAITLIAGVTSCSNPAVWVGQSSYDAELEGLSGVDKLLDAMSADLDAKGKFSYDGLQNWEPVRVFSAYPDCINLLNAKFSKSAKFEFTPYGRRTDKYWIYQLGDGSTLSLNWGYTSKYDESTNTGTHKLWLHANHGKSKTGTKFSLALNGKMNPRNRGDWAETLRWVEERNESRIRREERKAREEKVKAETRARRDAEEKLRRQRFDKAEHRAIIDTINSSFR